MTNCPSPYIQKKGTGWPPTLKPQRPFGPSTVEIIRSCPLRSCFDASPGYERRRDISSRIGSAFHRTLRSFYDEGLPRAKERAVDEARKRFELQLKMEELDAQSHPRERSLPRHSVRIDRATESIILEAAHFVESRDALRPYHHEKANLGKTPPPEATMSLGGSFPVEVEVPVSSANGMFTGRIDRARQGREGVSIYDFKSALRDDLPDRYQRQIQLYAMMWRQTRGEWPIAGYVVYPLTGKSYSVSVVPAVCQAVADESARAIDGLESEPVASRLAAPGEICAICEYRPWCKPFWSSQSGERSQTRAMEKASVGFSGPMTRLELRGLRWEITVAWRNTCVRLSAPEERLPFLHDARLGETALVLDTKMRGTPATPLAVFSAYSELFVLLD